MIKFLIDLFVLVVSMAFLFTQRMRLDGVSRIETDHEGDTVDVVVDDDVSDGALTAAVEATGYDVAA